MIKIKGWELAYFQSGEWQVVEERLKDYDHAKAQYNPARNQLFSALVNAPLASVRVAIVGQDPYPKRMHCTGIAFSIPRELGVDKFPPTLVNIFKEYTSDLHYPTPKNGDLTPWVSQGILLWNSYPSCATGKPGSHHWNEWENLTQEIIEKLDAKGNVVFVFLGSVAQHFSSFISNPTSKVIKTSHPSPLGANRGFLGSRVFTTVNNHLCSLKQTPIQWRLR